jgi:uncharacterized protein YnzC (UPF0291/DUF896 family)
MTIQAVTLNLPETVYEQIRRAAEKAQRPVNEVLVEAVTAAAPVIGIAPEELRTALAQMAYLNDAALWQAARATMTAEQRERLQALHDKQQREGLTAEEQAEEQALLALYRETLLVRAQATVLLKQRGYEVSDPQQFTPLE